MQLAICESTRMRLAADARLRAALGGRLPGPGEEAPPEVDIALVLEVADEYKQVQSSSCTAYLGHVKLALADVTLV